MRDNPPTHLDPRSPLVLDTRDLPRSPGAMRVVERVVPAPEDLGLELIRVPVGADLALRLRMESVSEGVLVSARAQAPLAGECGRCLRDDRRHAGRDVPGAVRLRAQHHGRDGRRGRGGPDAGRSDRPGAGTAGRGGARTAEPPAVSSGLPRAVPRVWGALGRPAGGPQPPAGRPRWAALDQFNLTLTDDRERSPVAVPKRKMSRSNTRSRRAQWKATAGRDRGLPAVPLAEAAARRVHASVARTTVARSSRSDPPGPG